MSAAKTVGMVLAWENETLRKEVVTPTTPQYNIVPARVVEPTLAPVAEVG